MAFLGRYLSESAALIVSLCHSYGAHLPRNLTDLLCYCLFLGKGLYPSVSVVLSLSTRRKIVIDALMHDRACILLLVRVQQKVYFLTEHLFSRAMYEMRVQGIVTKNKKKWVQRRESDSGHFSFLFSTNSERKT